MELHTLKPTSVPFSGLKTQPPKKRKNYHAWTCFLEPQFQRALQVSRSWAKTTGTAVPLILCHEPCFVAALRSASRTMLRGCIKMSSLRHSIIIIQFQAICSAKHCVRLHRALQGSPYLKHSSFKNFENLAWGEVGLP